MLRDFWEMLVILKRRGLAEGCGDLLGFKECLCELKKRLLALGM